MSYPIKRLARLLEKLPKPSS